jgi:hypothetical protein
MRYFKIIQYPILLMVVSLGISGCISTKTFPLRALPGETVALTLGRTSDEAGEGVTRQNLVVTITDVNGVSHIIDGTSAGGVDGKIQAVFRSFPDPLSQTTVSPPGGASFFSGQIGALIDLPTDLPAGSAKVSWDVLNGELPNYVFYFWPLSSFAKNIQLEVLSGGPGQPHVFKEKSAGYNDLTQLEPNPRIRFTVSTASTIGALEIQFNVDPLINPGNHRPIQQYGSLTGNTNLTYHTVTDNGSTYSNKTLIHLLRADGGPNNSFKFYAVWESAGMVLDLSGVEGVTIDVVDPNKGALDAAYFKAYDLNGNLLTDAEMTLMVFNQP